MKRLIPLLFLIAACAAPGTVEVYSLKPTKGLVRTQDNEVKPFSESKGYLCESPDDFEQTVTCTGGSVTVWSIEPSIGLVRTQEKKRQSFLESNGYFCVSPRDMSTILSKCD